MKTYCNGALVEEDKLIDILEPGFLFGWGVFETLRVYGGRFIFLSDHIARLRTAAEKVFLDFVDIDYRKEAQTLLQENNLNDAYCRITLFKKRQSTGVIIYVAPFTYYKLQDYQKGVRAIISPLRRDSTNFLYSVKTISYLENRLAWKYAQDKDKEEAIFVNERHQLAEGSRTNLFFVRNGKLYTPALECGILPGITRQKVIEIAKQNKIPVKEGRFKLAHLYSADEAFLTSSLMEVMPLVEVENQRISDGRIGDITCNILEAYRVLVRQEATSAGAYKIGQ